MTTPTRQITGTFLDSRLSPAAGKKIKLIPQEHRTDTVTKVLLDGDAVEVTLDVNGKIPTSPPVLVVCSDATGVEPHPVAYVLQKLFGDRERTLPFNIPAGSGPLDLADVVPLASAPTPAVSYWTAAQTAAADAAVLAAAEAYTDAHGGQVTKAAVIGTGVVASDLGGMTSAQINTAITTAVNNLLNGAPGALDTLRELADAINDDASFAATVTTALAGKAPIATTTIDLVDRTNNTTETVPAGTTTNCSTAGVTKTAPALDNPVATPPKRFAVKNISTGSITVAYPDQAGSAQSLTMLTGETRTFRQKSTSGWGVESGALALSTLDGRFAPITGSAAYVPVGSAALIDIPGLFVPGNDPSGNPWGYNLLTQLQSGPGVIAVHGDSVTQGMYTSSLRTKSWSGLLATPLQTKWGDGGSGFHSVVNSITSLTALGVGATARTAYQTAGDLWASTGTWTDANNRTGPGARTLSSAAIGDTLTATGRGRYIDVIIDATGFSYTIDGGSVQTVTGLTSGSVNTYTIDTGSAATRTIVVTTTTTATKVWGAYFRNAGGAMCRVDKYAVFGTTSNMMGIAGSSVAATLSGGAASTAATKANMLLYALFLNDAHSGTTSDVYAQNVMTDLYAFLTSLYGGTTTGAVDIAFVMPHIGKWDTSATPWALALQSEIVAMCRAHGWAYIDLTTLGHNSYDWANAQGYWGTSNATGAAGTDLVHLSDAGAAWMETNVARLLQAAKIL